MDSVGPISALSAITWIVLLLSSVQQSEAQLSPTFYDATCPAALSTIRTTIRQAVSRQRRMAAGFIRLHFHDCFAQGCDASILLDDTPSIQSEKSALPNSNLPVEDLDVVQAAKRAVELLCPGVVSCADILTLAARDASVAVGGPSWTVRLGRRDSTTANLAQANSDIPLSSANLTHLIESFRRKQFSAREMVALSGAHTLGQARCATFRNRIYNGSIIDPNFASTRRRQCPPTDGDDNLAPLDLVTPNSFDNNYFKNLLQRKGLLNSDQVLFSGGSTDNIVTEYSRSPQAFASDFASAMVKMSEISPLLGQNGIIRRVCSAIN